MKKKTRDFKDGFVNGVGWSFGVTFGFAIISTGLYFLLGFLGGLPLIGEGIAAVVRVTLESLARKTIVLP